MTGSRKSIPSGYYSWYDRAIVKITNYVKMLESRELQNSTAT